ncbi:hypothetical protein K440DRAFT_642740 [Wilcoxina mikolae CBS 423.85]|nr:hypothetical protein K440DRAFT_642740 [Wilcoxina mikolae CBS 423.85]
MNIVDESNLLRAGRSSTLGNTDSGTVIALTPDPMESGSIRQTNSYEGDPIKKLEFNKAKGKGKERKKGEKGHGRLGQNNVAEVEAARSEGTTGGSSEDSGSSNDADVSQMGNA